jgi:exopolysaccharide biosynthesis protein
MNGKRKNWWPMVFGTVLTLYAAFTLLDAFVLPGDLVTAEDLAHSAAQSSDAEASDGDTSAESEANNENTGSADSSDPVVTETSYESENISIQISTLTRCDTQVYVADITLQDASCLRTALADGAFGRNVTDTTSDIAEESGAILAVNGDYYGFRNRGFVMRGGYLYRDTAQKGSDYEDLVIYNDGSLAIVNEAASDAAALAETGAREIFSFGPGLIADGEITVTAGSEVEQAMRSNPRTAIGEIEPLHYVLVVSDGRTDESAGLTLLELAGVMEELGCRTAYNLDGGGSSTMWFMGEVINNPTGGRNSGERSVSDIVYIGE